MRCREWYSYHFPELYAMVQDNVIFAKLVVVIGDKAVISSDSVPAIQEVVGGDLDLAESIVHTAKTSMVSVVLRRSICGLFVAHFSF